MKTIVNTRVYFDVLVIMSNCLFSAHIINAPNENKFRYAFECQQKKNSIDSQTVYA